MSSNRGSPPIRLQEIADGSGPHTPTNTVDDVEVQPPSTAFKSEAHHDVNEEKRGFRPHSQDKASNDDRSTVIEIEENESDDDLPEFNHQDFQNKWLRALKAADDKENALCDEFAAYIDSFQVWYSTSSQKDNERAQKRLKTKLDFIQLSEQDLEAKKQHYLNVVKAFKSALDLLKASSNIALR